MRSGSLDIPDGSRHDPTIGRLLTVPLCLIGNTMNNNETNVVNIPGTLINSPVFVEQNQNGTQLVAEKHIEYEIDESTVRFFPQQPIERMNWIFILTFTVTTLGVLADLLGVLSYLGVSKGMGILALAPACLVVALITKKNRWLVSLQADGAARFADGLWYQKLPDGNFVSYAKEAKCIYPKCNGLVHVVPAPPREQPNHSLVGMCSVGGVRHTYTVDYNGIGFLHEFDWRPLEQEKKT